MTTGTDRIPPLWPYLLVCAAAGLGVPVGRFERHLSADSILTVLISLQHWTPFFWGQDRIGMLVPLLAVPFHSPLANLLFQHAVCVFAALAAMLLLPRYLLRNASYPLVGMLSGAAFLALAPAAFCFDFTANTFYGVWLAAGLGALVLAEDERSGTAPWWRLALALALSALAHWEYAGTALILGPLILLRGFLCRQAKPAPVWADYPRSASRARQIAHWVGRRLRGETTISLLLLAGGMAVGLALMRSARHVYPYGRTVVGSQPSSDWPSMWQQLAVNAWNALAPQHWPWFLAGALALGLLLLVIPSVRRHGGLAWRATACLLFGATVYFLFMGTRRWTHMNGCCYRYCHPVVFLLQGAMVILALAPLGAALPERLRKWLSGLAASGLLLAALTVYHPSLRASHAAVNASLGSFTEDILAARCTHVAGNYWNVWPAVYHANQVLHERHEKRIIWGITGRSELTRKFWQKVPLEEWRIAVPVDGGPNAQAVADYFRFPPINQCGAYPQLPGQTERVFAYFHLPPLVVVEKRRTVWVLRPQEIMAANEASVTLPGLMVNSISAEHRGLVAKHRSDTQLGLK